MNDRPSRAGLVRGVEARKIIPNLLTTVSLCSGMAALHFAVKAEWDRALAAIAVAAVFDALDGRAARLLHVSSRFGAVLDSLSDFLSFGVAPAFIIHQWMLRGQTPAAAGDAGGQSAKWLVTLVLAATMTYALCAALRLARFTAAARRAKPASPLSRFFVGMPSPAAAGAVLIPVMIERSYTFGQYNLPDWVVLMYTFVIGSLMISRVPMFSFKRVRVERYLVVPGLVIVGLFVAIAMKDPWLAASALAGLYLLSLPLSVGAYRRVRNAMRAAPHGA